MRAPHDVEVSSRVAIAVVPHFALPAVETILKEFARAPGGASLALNPRQLRLPFATTISVAVDVSVFRGAAQNEWHLHIAASQHPALYPIFDGVLTLLTASQRGAELELRGAYTPPLGTVGRAIDATVLRGAARESLDRFVREVAYRVAALAQWASS